MERETIATHAQRTVEVRTARSCACTWMRKKAWAPNRERRPCWRSCARHCRGEKLCVASRLFTLRIGFVSIGFVYVARKQLTALAVAEHARDRMLQDRGDFSLGFLGQNPGGLSC
jgi:hypothetical protein